MIGLPGSPEKSNAWTSVDPYGGRAGPSPNPATCRIRMESRNFPELCKIRNPLPSIKLGCLNWQQKSRRECLSRRDCRKGE
jgi:hypothetical protein